MITSRFNRPTPRAPFGGTFLGFVVGLLVGLGLALAVAIYISKVPFSFLDKGVSRDPTDEAAEAQRNKDWDPNAPLYGRSATKPAKKDEAASAPASAGPVLPPEGVPSNPAPSTGTANSAASPAEAEAANDPLGAFARQRSQASAEPFHYFVQAGAFRTQADADALSTKLQTQGFDTKVSEREQAARMVYRVRVGPLASKDEAEAIALKLKALKMDAVVVRVQR